MNRSIALALVLIGLLSFTNFVASPTAAGTDVGDLERAANAGDSEAMYNLFLATFRNADTHPLSDEDRKRGLQWLERAARLGNWRAAFVLAESYKYGGFGYSKDSKKEAYWRKIFEKNRPKSSRRAQ